jgi:hypothetical protein
MLWQYYCSTCWCKVLTLILSHGVYAGAVYSYYGHLYMDHTNVTRNQALRHGGGLYIGTRTGVNDSVTVGMSDVMCRSQWNASSPLRWVLNVGNCSILKNTAGGNGGACAEPSTCGTTPSAVTVMAM